jgi:putative restriction endonuclease
VLSPDVGRRTQRRDTDFRVHVSPLLDDEDGQMLDMLKRFHGTTIEAPAKRLWRPNPERLAVRFERFSSAV